MPCFRRTASCAKNRHASMLREVGQGGWVVSLSVKVGELPDIGQLGDSKGEGETQPGGDVLGWWVGYFWE